MRRTLNRWVVAILTPPFRAVGLVVTSLYSLLFGWYDKRLARMEQRRLEEEVREQLSFLFSTRNAHLLPSREIDRLANIDWPTVTISVDGLLLRFRRWRGELQAYVATEREPNDWEELSLVLSLIETPENVERKPVYWLSDVARWLKLNLDHMKNAFSEDHYSTLKKRLAEASKYDRVVARQWENEINRRLYG
jgi:hypothetical protein